jgi:NhaA family Na+:H+ antiporter
MSEHTLPTRLSRPVDSMLDHVLGPETAEVTLVEYGSYVCRYCQAANERVAALRDQFGERLRYVYRHRPIPGNDLARKAADIVERAQDPDQFWRLHVALMEAGEALTEEQLAELERTFGIETADADARRRAARRVERDMDSARDSGVYVTPTFFINGRRYDGAWDSVSFNDAVECSFGYRIRAAALDFARWAPSAGLLLLLATIVALIVSNSPLAGAFDAIWEQEWGLTAHGNDFKLSLRHWVNDALLTVFFLVVGLEIKREFTVGHLASRQSAALPIAAAIGGLALPALIYKLFLPEGDWAHGWGVPMSTDTAFAVALIAMMGQRVPLELRIFLTAAAIVDDIGAILVVAAFYSSELNYLWLGGAAALAATLALLNQAHVYRLSPYLLVGVALWYCVFSAGIHATLAGVLLALFIPTLPPPNLKSLTAQANAILLAESRADSNVLRRGPSTMALHALDSIHDRLESPADRLLRSSTPRSSYFVLPLFALANSSVPLTGLSFAGHESLLAAIAMGLVVGKPLGLALASYVAVKAGLAVKPDEYSWRQLIGAGALSGIGFTMSLFIASEAFPVPADFNAAKVAIFGASVISAIAGVVVLWNAEAKRAERGARELDAAETASQGNQLNVESSSRRVSASMIDGES